MSPAPSAEDQKLHEIDPNGDTLLILRNANAPFAVATPSRGPPKKRPKLKSVDGKPEIRMKLSSRHLTLASAYFRKLTANKWKERKSEGDYAYVVNADDWDEQALLILMNIIHGRTAELSTSMNLETLAKICALVDYYQCHEALKFFNRIWLQGIDRASPTGGDLLLRLSVACVFPDATTFQKLTMTLIKESKESIDSLGLPIPRGVIDALNKQRESFICAIVSGLKGLIEAECAGNGLKCTFECSSVFIGALIKGMDKARISQQHVSLPPYTGHSLVTLQNAILGIAEPSWKRFCGRGHYSLTCTLASKTIPIVDGYINQVVGLRLGDFIKHSV